MTEKPVKTKLISSSFVQISFTPSTCRSTLVGSDSMEKTVRNKTQRNSQKQNKKKPLTSHSINYHVLLYWELKQNHTKTPPKGRLNFQKKVSLCWGGGKGALLKTFTERNSNTHCNKWNSYLVIDWYHEVSVDRGTIRLIFQGTLFSVQLDLWQTKHNLLNSTEQKYFYFLI